jgi:hypothetical protein
MNTYHIKIDGLYFAGISEREIGKAAVGGWYDEGTVVKGFILSPHKENAKLIEGNINLKSYWNKIYDAIRYGDVNFSKIEIVKVDVK